METKREEVRVFRIERQCDQCSGGKMIFSGQSFGNHDTSYSHKCNNCGYDNLYKDKYPILEYENI